MWAAEINGQNDRVDLVLPEISDVPTVSEDLAGVHGVAPPTATDHPDITNIVVDLTDDDHLVVSVLRPLPDGARFVEPHDGLLGASTTAKRIKRAVDVVVAFLSIVILSPLMVAIAVAVWITSPGPALFSQTRVGRHGETFRLLKFRTMFEDADDERADLESINEVDGPVFKIKRDPRVTPLGSYLRRSSLDELPQIFHVLSGRMSIVGPRPPLPQEVETYNSWERQRLYVQPGLTCIWQVSGRSDLDFTTWMKMDIDYIARWSLTLDLLLLAKTIPAVVSRRGAY